MMCAGEGGSDDASAALVAASSYLDMLTDKRRNLAYRLAIERAVAHMVAEPSHAPSHQQGTAADAPTSVRPVLDIGTGTGLLAMMAARALTETCKPGTFAAHGAQPAAGAVAHLDAIVEEGEKGGDEQAANCRARQPANPVPSVVACELFPPMAHLAQRVIRANGLQDHIQVILKRSDELSVGPEPTSLHSPPPAHVPEDRPDHMLSPGTNTNPQSQHPRRHNTAASVEHHGASGRSSAGPHAQLCQPDLPCKAGLVVTEIFDSELLGEGVLPTMRHAVPNLLAVRPAYT